jgi:hypothetical protein
MKYAAILLLLAGCGDDTNMNPIIHDMSMSQKPDANLGVPIGGQCTLSTDCKQGTNPSCRKAQGVKTGMCTSDCQTDSDCSSDGSVVCLFQPTNGSSTPGACAKACQMATDCTEGIACWVTLDKVACWPINGVQDGAGPIVLNCDPTVAGCTYKNSPLPGGCERQVLGPGSAGVCRQGCDIGVGTCPKYGTDDQNCYLIDETIDSNNMPTGDALKQPICIVDVPVGSPPAFIADGAECLDPMSGNHFFDICEPGSQCEISMTSSGGMPDNKCHRLCYLGSFMPPDMGALFADGGIAGACPSGTTCTDVFGTASATPPGMPVGLCI